MKKYNVVTKKVYVKDGQEKKQWMNVGTLTHFPKNGDRDEGFILELAMFPDTKFSVFEQKPRENVQRENKVDDSGEQKAYAQSQTKVEYPTDDITPEDIPF